MAWAGAVASGRALPNEHATQRGASAAAKNERVIKSAFCVALCATRLVDFGEPGMAS